MPVVEKLTAGECCCMPRIGRIGWSTHVVKKKNFEIQLTGHGDDGFAGKNSSLESLISCGVLQLVKISGFLFL